jgi:proteic killer suppression protein
MIESFRHKGLKRLYDQGDRKALPPEMVQRIRIILADLEAAVMVEEMDRPSFKLHALTGDRKGLWSVTVHANWRIVFRFEDGKAFDIDFLDYH